jgi:hypothetical protein
MAAERARKVIEAHKAWLALPPEAQQKNEKLIVWEGPIPVWMQ